jgi:hypothetical protein
MLFAAVLLVFYTMQLLLYAYTVTAYTVRRADLLSKQLNKRATHTV